MGQTVGREIVLDTETTGLDPSGGHRIVEIGCVELINLVPSGRTFHTYVNPKRFMPKAAFAVHGLSQAFLANHPVFEDVASDFLSFVEGAPLVIHNASFDMKFLQAELALMDQKLLDNEVVDTLMLARKKFPGAPASLDMLCRRFAIDASKREKHGALLDAELLASVYLELCGGRQPTLTLASKIGQTRASKIQETTTQKIAHLKPRSFPVEEAEKTEHKTVLRKIKAAHWSS